MPVFCIAWSVISRPGQSQGLLYKHLCHLLIHLLSHPFPPTALQRHHAQTVRDSSSSYRIDYVIVIKNFLNREGHQNRITGSKVTTILVKGQILPIGGVASGRVCVCSLCSRLILVELQLSSEQKQLKGILKKNLFYFCGRQPFLLAPRGAYLFDKIIMPCFHRGSRSLFWYPAWRNPI